LHAQAGRRAKQAGISRLFALGPLSAATVDAFGEGATHFDTHDLLAEALRRELHGAVRVLVKGSRGSAMDRIVAALLPTQQETDDAACAHPLAGAARGRVRPVRLSGVPRRPRRAARTHAVAVVGSGGDPPPRPAQGWPADPQGRAAVAF